MARRQQSDLAATAEEVLIGEDKERHHSLLNERREGCIDFTFIARANHEELEPQRARPSRYRSARTRHSNPVR